MKKSTFLLTLALCATTAFSTAFAAKVVAKATITPHAVQEGVFKCNYPLVSDTKDAASNTAINAKIAESVMNFTAPFNKLVTQGNPISKIDKKVNHKKITGSVDYTLTCNGNTLVSMILNKTVYVPQINGKTYTLNLQEGHTFNTEGTVIKAADWSQLAKIAGEQDPFSNANIKESIVKTLAERGLTAVQDYESNLDMARSNYYVDKATNLHALFMPGLVATEAAGWIDVQLTK